MVKSGYTELSLIALTNLCILLQYCMLYINRFSAKFHARLPPYNISKIFILLCAASPLQSMQHFTTVRAALQGLRNSTPFIIFFIIYICNSICSLCDTHTRNYQERGKEEDHGDNRVR